VTRASPSSGRTTGSKVASDSGFHRIRYYGLLATGQRAENVARARKLLTLPILPVDAIKAATINADEPSKGQFLTNWEKSRAHSGLLDPSGL
jgi:hypothetical protein